ncbi:MAG TPA: hypothetical protein VGM23_18600 [Armatimonadota bacterium]|jgi:hypothetical protein
MDDYQSHFRITVVIWGAFWSALFLGFFVLTAYQAQLSEHISTARKQRVEAYAAKYPPPPGSEIDRRVVKDFYPSSTFYDRIICYRTTSSLSAVKEYYTRLLQHENWQSPPQYSVPDVINPILGESVLWRRDGCETETSVYFFLYYGGAMPGHRATFTVVYRAHLSESFFNCD